MGLPCPSPATHLLAQMTGLPQIIASREAVERRPGLDPWAAPLVTKVRVIRVASGFPGCRVSNMEIREQILHDDMLKTAITQALKSLHEEVLATSLLR